MRSCAGVSGTGRAEALERPCREGHGRGEHREDDAAGARRRLLAQPVDGGRGVVVSARRRHRGVADLGGSPLAPVAEGTAEQQGRDREEGEQGDGAERQDCATERSAPAHRSRHVATMRKP